MVKLEYNKMEVINASTVSSVIDGVCAAVGMSWALSWLVLTTPQGIAITAACAINSYAGSEDWW